jgi:predicted SAM-dependent methyltransferase
MTDYHSIWTSETTPRHPLKKILCYVFPVHLLEQIKFELHMMIVRIKGFNNRRQFAGRKDLLVNVGAGDSGNEGWINIDGFPGRGVTCLADARKRLPFQDNSVKGIFSEHFFEHIDYTEEAPHFLRECFRSLQPGGVVRIIVPDLERYLKAYVQDDWSLFAKIRPLDESLRDHAYGWRYNTQMELINFVFRQGQQHKFAYDFATMEFLLRKCGFTNIKRQDYGKSQMRELCIDNATRASESLYVEAMK